jgi:hypothetical protein
MICSSMCALHRLAFPQGQTPNSVLDQVGNVRARTELLFFVALAALRAELRQSLHELRNGVLDLQG